MKDDVFHTTLNILFRSDSLFGFLFDLSSRYVHTLLHFWHSHPLISMPKKLVVSAAHCQDLYLPNLSVGGRFLGPEKSFPWTALYLNALHPPELPFSESRFIFKSQWNQRNRNSTSTTNPYSLPQEWRRQRASVTTQNKSLMARTPPESYFGDWKGFLIEHLDGTLTQNTNFNLNEG